MPLYVHAFHLLLLLLSASAYVTTQTPTATPTPTNVTRVVQCTDVKGVVYTEETHPDDDNHALIETISYGCADIAIAASELGSIWCTDNKHCETCCISCAKYCPPFPNKTLTPTGVIKFNDAVSKKPSAILVFLSLLCVSWFF